MINLFSNGLLIFHEGYGSVYDFSLVSRGKNFKREDHHFMCRRQKKQKKE